MTLRKLQNLQNRHFSLMALQFSYSSLFSLFNQEPSSTSLRPRNTLDYISSSLFDNCLAKFRYFRNFRSTVTTFCDFSKFRNRVQSWPYLQDQRDNKKRTTILTISFLACFMVQTHFFGDTSV